MNDIKLDNHKLMYHPERVSKWLRGETTYPIYVEISLTSACNHRCIYCAPNFFLNYKPVYLDSEVIKKTITNMAECGVKAIMFGGEGEPTLHKDIYDISKHAVDCGIDVGLTTNGSMLTLENAKRIIPYIKWIKFSLDAMDLNIQSKLHGIPKTMSKKVLYNISKISWYKRLREYDCTIGVQALVLKYNINNLPKLAKYLKHLKVDYFVMKPFSNHTSRLGEKLDIPTKEELNWLKKEVKKYEEGNYKVIFREEAFENLDKPKIYDKCYAQDFMAYIDTLGGVHSCINFIGDDDYEYGNIYKETFENIWKNKHIIEPDLKKCRDICRMDLINIYLWKLKNPIEHINFI